MNQLLILYYYNSHNWQPYFSIPAYNSVTGDSLHMKSAPDVLIVVAHYDQYIF